MLLPCRQTEQPGTAVESWRWSGPHHLSCVEPHQTLPAPQSNSKGVGPPHGSTGHHEQDDASCYCAVVTRPEGGAVCENAQRTTYNNDCLASRVRRNRRGMCLVGMMRTSSATGVVAFVGTINHRTPSEIPFTLPFPHHPRLWLPER